jgi:hypothetical protein
MLPKLIPNQLTIVLLCCSAFLGRAADAASRWKVDRSQLRSANGGSSKLRYGSTTRELKLGKGESCRMTK